MAYITLPTGTYIINIGLYINEIDSSSSTSSVVFGAVPSESTNLNSSAGVAVADRFVHHVNGRFNSSFAVKVTESSRSYYLKAYCSNGGYNTGSSDFYAIRIK